MWPHALLFCALVLGACSVGFDEVATLPGDGGASPGSAPGGPPGPSGDGGSGLDPFSCARRACTSACPTGQRCAAGLCIADQGTCQNDDDCLSDSRCEGGVCVPYDDPCRSGPRFDPGCVGGAPASTGPPLLPGTVGTLCHLENAGSTSTPLVADLDRDGRPEIIFTISDDNGDAIGINAVHGDCSPFWTSPLAPTSEMAIADLDGDGSPEIVVQTSAAGPPTPGSPPAYYDTVVVLDARGQVKARSPALAQTGNIDGSYPSIVDIDGAPPAEILLEGRVLRYDGARNTLDLVWDRARIFNDDSIVDGASVAADLDGDGRPEVIDRGRILDGLTGDDRTPPGFAPVGHCNDCDRLYFYAVADFNRDGSPDVVEVTADGISVWDYKNARALVTLPAKGNDDGYGLWGGPPLVADFDGDGVPDFGIADDWHYTAYATKCFASPPPAGCQGPGYLWQIPIQDGSSGNSSSAAFDLDGDGELEIVYRDEVFLRILGARDGRTKLIRNITSTTAIEYPVIADVDGDGHADIVVMSDSYEKGTVTPMPDASTGTSAGAWTQGLFVFSNPAWAPARPLWNQHEYHASNINDDLTVPARDGNRWKSTGDEHVQRPPNATFPPPALRGSPLVDLTGRLELPLCRGATFTMRGTVCNRGAATQTGGVPATFYDGSPGQGGKLLCTAHLGDALAPGECRDVSCQVPAAPAKTLDLFLRVGDDGTGSKAPGQCHADNDLATLPRAPCGQIVE